MIEPPVTPDLDATRRSQKPFMLRAIHEWLCTFDYTPHILIALKHPELVVPPHLKVGETLTLNISMAAASHLVMGNDLITFAARFNQKSFAITVPVGAVLAIFGKETREGIMLDYHEVPAISAGTAPAPSPSEPAPKARPSFLKVVK